MEGAEARANEEGKRMNAVLEEDPIITMAKELEAAYWADAAEKEMYYRRQRLLLDAYSAEHTYEILFAREKKRLEEEMTKEKQKLKDEMLKKIEAERQKIEAERQKIEQSARAIEDEKRKAEHSAREARLEIARNLLKTGMDVNQIAQVSGLSPEELELSRN
jgi:hypothetical protein